jgi:hypothetical protein
MFVLQFLQNRVDWVVRPLSHVLDVFLSFRVIDSRVHLLLVGNFAQSREDVRRQTT